MAATSSKDWLAANPPPDSAFAQSLAHAAVRIRNGEALALAQSPAAFRRRGIFIARGALQRV